MILVPVHFQNHLGGIVDAVGRMKRVVVLQQGKVGDGVEAIQKWTRDQEKVAQHPIGKPIDRQVRQAVEYVQRPRSRLLDDVHQPLHERLKPRLRIELDDRGAFTLLEQRGMAGESEIDQVFPPLTGKGLERSDERNIILDGIDFPDDIVARYQTLKYPVQTSEPCSDRFAAFRTCV